MFLSNTLSSDSELKVVGEYGLRNKREVWRVQLTLSKIRRAARYVGISTCDFVTGYRLGLNE